MTKRERILAFVRADVAKTGKEGAKPMSQTPPTTHRGQAFHDHAHAVNGPLVYGRFQWVEADFNAGYDAALTLASELAAALDKLLYAGAIATVDGQDLAAATLARYRAAVGTGGAA